MRNLLIDTDIWREIVATLARNKTRTFLTAFGIFWGTAMLAMLHGGATGLSGMMMRQFKGFSTNMGGFGPGQTSMPYKGYNKGMRWTLTLDDIERGVAMSDVIDLWTPIMNTYGPTSYGTKSKSGMINGVNADFFGIQIPKVLAGRALNEQDVASTAKNVVIGKNIALELFGTDPEFAIGKYVSVNGLYYRVVGVVAQTSDASLMGRLDDSVTMPITTLNGAMNMGRDVNFFLFTAKEGHAPKEVFPVLRRAARLSHPIAPEDDKAFEEFDISEMFTMVGYIFMGIDFLALFVGLGTLMAGVIGVGNIMWIIVRERTGEIGIRRAIGAKPRNIIMQVLAESMVLTTVAGTAGICFATIVLMIVEHITMDPILGSAGFQLTFGASVTILVLFLVLGTAAGLIPSIKAMRIKPVEAMRTK